MSEPYLQEFSYESEDIRTLSGETKTYFKVFYHPANSGRIFIGTCLATEYGNFVRTYVTRRGL